MYNMRRLRKQGLTLHLINYDGVLSLTISEMWLQPHVALHRRILQILNLGKEDRCYRRSTRSISADTFSLCFRICIGGEKVGLVLSMCSQHNVSFVVTDPLVSGHFLKVSYLIKTLVQIINACIFSL